MNRFDKDLGSHGLTLRRTALPTRRINGGGRCNQTFRHCHVDAAPGRSEMMSAGTALRVAEWIRMHRRLWQQLHGRSANRDRLNRNADLSLLRKRA